MWTLEQEKILLNLVRPFFGRRRPRTKGVKEFVRLLTEGTLRSTKPDLSDDQYEEIIENLHNKRYQHDVLTEEDIAYLKGIQARGRDFYFDVVKKRRDNLQNSDQQIRKDFIELTERVLTIHDASKILVESGLCRDLIADFVTLTDKLSVLKIEVPARNPNKLENWHILEDRLTGLVRVNKITLSQLETCLIDKEAATYRGLSNSEIDILVLEARNETNGDAIKKRLWEIFKPEVRKRFGRYKRRLLEVGLDYDDYQAYAQEFFLKKLRTFNADRNVPFRAYFLMFMRPEMDRWVDRKINTTGKEKTNKHSLLVKEYKDQEVTAKYVDFPDYVKTLREIKQTHCAENAKVRVVSGKVNKEPPLPFVPVPKIELKNLFLPENVEEYSGVLTGRQKVVFECYYGNAKITESTIAVQLNTTQQNVSKLLKRAAEKIFNSCI
ncbi:MAG: hypothetical protein M0Z55_01515 [Peptococcaceae bacterium]|nr:hypothetical protein [Peptococcaceae bacterium]